MILLICELFNVWINLNILGCKIRIGTIWKTCPLCSIQSKLPENGEPEELFFLQFCQFMYFSSKFCPCKVYINPSAAKERAFSAFFFLQSCDFFWVGLTRKEKKGMDLPPGQTFFRGLYFSSDFFPRWSFHLFWVFECKIVIFKEYLRKIAQRPPPLMLSSRLRPRFFRGSPALESNIPIICIKVYFFFRVSKLIYPAPS